jgi:ribosomal-protein-alanine N-acetyltransferase
MRVFNLILNSENRGKPTQSSVIRRATPEDIPSLISLERICATAAHWTEQQYEKMFQPGADLPARLLLVAEGGREGLFIPTSATDSEATSYILGFLVARHIPPEWELENIVVAPEARRAGLGRQLLGDLLTHAREAKQSVFLEVRQSNAVARFLYEKAGFQLTGHRKSYYTNPQEDAVLYRWVAD